MATDLTIIAGKGIKISGSNGGIIIRNGNLKNFSWTSIPEQGYYFNRTKGTKDDYDWYLKWADITTYNGDAVVPSYVSILADLQAECVLE